MGFWDFGKPVDINSKLAEARSTANALIIDVREPREYEYGHIPGALNLPVNSVGTIRTALAGWLIEGHASQTPLYLYCVSGARSKKAQGLLKAMGFQIVENMGGINRFTGQFEKGPMPESPVPAATGSEPEPAAAESQAETEPPVSDPASPNTDAAAETMSAAPGLDDLEGPVTDPRVDALTAELVAELEGGNVTVKRFQNEDAAKVYLMSKISGGLDLKSGMLLFTRTAAEDADGKNGAEIILIDEQ